MCACVREYVCVCARARACVSVRAHVHVESGKGNVEPQILIKRSTTTLH